MIDVASPLLPLADLALGLGGGRRIVLAGSALGWVWLAVGVVAVALLVLLYRAERQLTSRRAGLALLGLRLAAALALLAALFEPVAERTRQETRRGRVVVGVDLSASLDTTDPGRTADERAALAKALALEPGANAETLTRREVARRLLGTPWLAELSAAHDVELIGFAREAVAGLTPAALIDRLATPPAPDDAGSLATDWTPVLERALAEGSGPTLGVVLLTDGRQNAAAPGAGASTAAGGDPIADRLAARGVPIFPVQLGSTVPPPDAAIVAVRAPDRATVGDVADVEVTLKLDGQAPGAAVPVTLERPGAEAIRQTATVPAGGGRPTVTFRVPLEGPGVLPLTVAVGPVEGDTRPENDRRALAIEATDDRARVLLVDGEPRWEFQYLRNALRRDPHVTVDAVVFRQPTPPETASPTYLPALPAEPAEGPDPLAAYDLIVVGDVTPDDLPPAAWRRLAAYVDARGGTLALAAGPRAWPGLASDEAVRALLPVVEPRPIAFDPATPDPAHPSLPAGVTLAPAAEADAEPSAWPMLRLAADAARSRAAWDGLPRLPWALAGRIKPTATALLVPAAESGAPADATTAVVAALPYGLGKVLWVGTDGTWRWRYRVGDAYHHRFWGQVVRWAGAGKLAAGNRLVRYGPSRPRAPEGQGVALRAQFAEEADGLTPGTLVVARVFRAGPDGAATGEAVAVVPLRPSAGRPRLFEGEAPALPAGRYAVRIEAPPLAGLPTDAAPLEITPLQTSERIELAAGRDALDRLATPGGGRVFREWELADLPPRIAARSRPETRVESTTLWDQPLALAVFVGLLTLEWIGRKRLGLP